VVPAALEKPPLKRPGVVDGVDDELLKENEEFDPLPKVAGLLALFPKLKVEVEVEGELPKEPKPDVA
jgi:hypothetical protein